MAISKPSTSPVIPVITETTWLTLTDTEAGYSLSYPANFHWQVLKRKDGLSNINSLSFDLPDVHARQTMRIQVEPNPNKFSVRIFLKKLYEQNNMLDESSALIQTTIKSLIVYQTANFPEKIAEQTANRAEIPDFHILVPYKDKVYRFTLLHDAAISESTPVATAIFFKIIATFHNTDSTPVKPAARWALPQVDPFDDWITFIDKEAGYSLRYPANFFISQGGQSK
ncbi:MAG: hypothetical protein NT075_28840 [Chloroflexi bacterium]|nr:hypothetical protein [Chloroflexota bacterium]